MNNVILITGTSFGIGNYLANHYDNQRDIVIGCSRTAYDCEYINIKADITKLEDVNNLFSYIKNTYGKLDVLINNAGTSSMNPFLLTPMDTVRRISKLNFESVFDITQRASRLMVINGFGRIVNIVSVATPMNLAGESVYVATKAAVESLTKVLAKELGVFGITVNAVGPTPIDTNLIKGVPQNKIDQLINQQAIQRKGTFEDVSNVVDFFIKPESNFITGQIIYLGGIC